MPRPWLSLLITAPLLGQGYMSRSTADAWNVPNLAFLKQQLAREHGSALLVVGPATSAQALRNLLAEEPLLPLRLRAQALDPAKGLGKQLCAQQNWDGKSIRWVLLDSKGIAAGEGPGLPTATEVLKAFQATGCRPRLEVLERMVEEHPDHLEAAQALLHELRRIGEARTYRALRREVPAPRTQTIQVDTGSMLLDGSEEEAEERPLPTLSDQDDARCWDAYARLLERVLPDLLPMTPLLGHPPVGLLPRCLPASPRLQEAARHLLPEVERWLTRHPSSEPLWALWIALRGDRSIQDLLAGLTPDPFTAPGRWPPPAAQASYIRDCRGRQDWKGLLAFAEPAWKDIVVPLSQNPGGKGHTALSLVVGTWRGLAEPLLEAFLRTQRTFEAQQLVETWMAHSGYKNAASRAASLARACGEEALAEKWAKAGS